MVVWMSSDLVALPPERQCLICSRPATCRNYGVISCDGCKMFFRRTVIDKKSYSCKKTNNCLEDLSATQSICRACRINKCLELGMEFLQNNPKIREVKDRKSGEFVSVLRDLSEMDSTLHSKYLNFYTEEDPALQDILEGRGMSAAMERPNQPIPAHQWTFLGMYTFISLCTNISFIQQLELIDKMRLFRYCSVRICTFRAAMKNLRERRDRFFTPDGREAYPKEIVDILKVNPQVMKRICGRLISRMIELKVTDQEFVLLQMILFCNPAIPNLSSAAQSILSANQRKYTSILLQYCQLQYQNAAPSRLTDLFDLYQVIQKTFEDLQYIAMIFKCFVPGFRFHALAIETFQLPEKVDLEQMNKKL